MTSNGGGPGWKTSEFWLTALPIAGVFVLLAIGRLEVDDAMRLWPLFTGGGMYAISRGLAKVKSEPEP